MATGTIKTLVSAKGFGFITPEGGSPTGDDLFFHQTSVIDGTFDELQTGQQVSFDEEPDPRDPRRRRAANVAVTGD
jgi:CspA family cold shock protein